MAEPGPQKPDRPRAPRKGGTKTRTIPLLGWREWIGLPELGVPWIHAKLDTGARTSALHAEQVEPLPVEPGGLARVRFQVRSDGSDDAELITVVAELIEERWIRSSNGHRERRPVVRTQVRVGQDTWPIELTLTGRGEMGFQLLLGRQAMKGRFAVDPGRSWVGGIPESPSRADSPTHRTWRRARRARDQGKT